jgi:hypothetical protein
MTLPFALTCMIATSTFISAANLDVDSVQSKPLAISASMDFGQIIHGNSTNPPAAFKGQFLQRTGVWLTQEATVKERLAMTMGVGGMFWYALPEQKAQPRSLITRFGPGISKAFATYTFGEIEKPMARLQMGFFPYKSSPDAKNLGEYLLRSGTYPGALMTGGWNIVSSAFSSSASYMLQGIRLNVPLWDGRFQSDFLLPMERDLPPMYDLSPSYVASLRLTSGFEIGGGFCWNHGIPIKPSKESPHVDGNRIILSRKLNPDTTAVVKGSDAYYIYAYDTAHYYTYQGIKISGRFSFDPKPLLGIESAGSSIPDWKIYAEAAVLGWKNYPYLYAKRTQRIPIMAGFNLPTFGLLDVLSMEVQHYQSDFENSIYEPYQNQTPIWTLEDDPGDAGRASYKPGATPEEDALAIKKAYGAAQAMAKANRLRALSDDWKWTLYAKREVSRGLSLYAQAASDHLRPIDLDLKPFWIPVTNRNGKDWYYLIRLEFGI